MRLFDLIQLVLACKNIHDSTLGHNPEVVLVVDGVAFPIEQVWWEPNQNGKGAICLGDDPR